MTDKEICDCHNKSTVRLEQERKKLIHRLNRIEGQIRGIKGMIEKDAYCPDILVQSAAVSVLMERHKSCKTLWRHAIRKILACCQIGYLDIFASMMMH